jgi:hypothetical protein
MLCTAYRLFVPTTLAQLAVASQVKPPGAIQHTTYPNCTLWLALLAHGCYNLLFQPTVNTENFIIAEVKTFNKIVYKH